MRRALAVGLCLAAFVLVAIVGVQMWRCGARSVSEECFSPEECLGESTCGSVLHPFLPPFGAAALLGVWLAWRRMPRPLLALGVVGAAFGVLSGFSLGFAGLAVSALLLAAGCVIGAPLVVCLSAVLAFLAPMPGLLLVTRFATNLPVVWAAALAPAVLWLGAMAIMAHSEARKEAGRALP